MAGLGAAGWDDRYRERGPDPGEPEPALVAALGPLAAGRAVDLACGAGRHALWLAAAGWRVTAVDFSAVGVERGRAAAERRGLAVEWVVADVREWVSRAPAPVDPAPVDPVPVDPVPVDLVLAARVRLPAPVLQAAARWLAPGGRLVVLGHAAEAGPAGDGRRPANGPRDPALRHTEDFLRAAADGLVVERLDRLERATGSGPAVDLLLVARRDA